jgi:large subunit ribosomal protein L30
MMTQLKIRQVRSAVGGKQYQRDTLRTLGLKRVGDSSTREDRPEVRGMIKKVAHMVAVEEVD